MPVTYNCDQSTELFWEYLYGLLDEEQAQAVRVHLAGCAQCQQRLDRCAGQQKLVAQAARIYDALPPFAVPLDEAPLGTDSAHAAKTLPLPPARGAGPARFRRWLGVAAAAAVLLVVGGYVWYRGALGEMQEMRQSAVLAVRNAEKQTEQESQQAHQQAAALPRRIASEAAHLEVIGPAAIQEGVPAVYRAVANDLNGEPLNGEVTARVVALAAKGEARRQVIFEQKLSGKSDLAFSLPANLKLPADSRALLEVEARGRRSRARLSNKLEVAGPTCRAQMDIDKRTYRTGDILYFRTLVLNPFTGKPPEKPLSITTSLADCRGARRILSHGQTRADGIAGGGFALTHDLCEGECVVEAIEAQGRFPPVFRTFHLIRGEPSQSENNLIFDRSTYRPGDDLGASFRANRRENAKAAANQPITAKVKIEGAAASGPAAASQTNAKGEASFRLKLPPTIPRGRADLEVKIGDGKSAETYTQSIPVVISRQKETGQSAGGEVELFPEGGRLVAGLPSRMYYRARDDRGAALDLEGSVVDTAGKEIAKLRTEPKTGVGVFSVTPKLGTTYALRIRSPAKAAFKTSFPRVYKTGVVLRLPDGLSTADEPLAVAIEVQGGSDRKLIITAKSRDQLVDQRTVKAAPGTVRTELMPPSGITGPIRVTVYEVHEDRLVPLAERLTYRMPARRLDIALPANKHVYKAGERVSLNIQTTSEKNRAEPAVLLARVVDANALKSVSRAATTLPSFYLSSDLGRPEDLEQIEIWARDDAQSRQDLDRFLATEGWRRFGEAPKAPLANSLLVKSDRTAGFAGKGQGLALLSLDNGPEAQKQYRKELQAARDQMKTIAAAKADDWAREQKRLGREVMRAEMTLDSFKELPRKALGYALVVLVGILLTGGSVTLVVAIVRTVRRTGATTPLFATSFASLLLCLATVIAFRLQTPTSPHGFRDAQSAFGSSAPSPWEGFNLRRDALAEAHLDGNGLSSGLYAELPHVKQDDAKSERKLAGRRDEISILAADQRRATLMNRSFGAPRKGQGGEGNQDQDPSRARQFNALKDAQQKGMDKAATRFGARPASGLAPMSRAPTRLKEKNGVNKKDAQTPKEARSALQAVEQVPIEYAHVHLPGTPGPDLQETVLWAPLLNAATGRAKVAFDLPDRNAIYHILVLGHGSDGRIGMAQGTLDARANVPASSTTKPQRAK